MLPENDDPVAPEEHVEERVEVTASAGDEADDVPAPEDEVVRNSFAPVPPPRAEDPPTHPATKWVVTGVLGALLGGIVVWGVIQSQQDVSPVGDTTEPAGRRHALPTPPDLVDTEPAQLVSELTEATLLVSLLGGVPPNAADAVTEICDEAESLCALAEHLADPSVGSSGSHVGVQHGWISWLSDARACVRNPECGLRTDPYADLSRDTVEEAAFIAVGLRERLRAALHPESQPQRDGMLTLAIHAVTHEFAVGREQSGVQIASDARQFGNRGLRRHRDLARVVNAFVDSDADPFIRAGLETPVEQRLTILRGLVGTSTHRGAVERIVSVDGRGMRDTIESAMGLSSTRIERVLSLRSAGRRAVGVWRPDLAAQACEELTPLTVTPSRRPSEAYRMFAESIMAHRVFCGPNAQHDALLRHATAVFSADEHAIAFAIRDISME